MVIESQTKQCSAFVFANYNYNRLSDKLSASDLLLSSVFRPIILYLTITKMTDSYIQTCNNKM